MAESEASRCHSDNLTGLTFQKTTGVLSWDPAITASGIYEFKIVATDNNSITTNYVTVNMTPSTDAPPALDAFIAKNIFSQGGRMEIVNAGDGGDDQDAEGDVITYECWFDQTQNNVVTESSATQCTSANLPGIGFDSSTGILDWNARDHQTGYYEFKIKASTTTGVPGTDTDYQDVTVSPANLNIASTTWTEEAYIKASNNDAGDLFGSSVSLYQNTLAVGAAQEASLQSTITNGTTTSSDDSNSNAGAVYVYQKSGSSWAQEAYIKAVNNGTEDQFGTTVSIEKDTLVVGAQYEKSQQSIITNGTTASSDDSSDNSGAVYIYKRSGNTWTQEAYLKAENNGGNDYFGSYISLDDDTLAVAALFEASNQTTITNGTTASADNSSSHSGAVYIYKRSGNTWAQEAYIKSVNNDASDIFGNSISLDKSTLAVGASFESSSQTTITNGTLASGDNSLPASGAIYIYTRTGSEWSQQAYIKSANADTLDGFGATASLYGDSLAVGAASEDANQTTITNGSAAPNDDSSDDSGAVYIYKRTGSTWKQEAYIKPGNSDAGDEFGRPVTLNGDTLAVAASGESSSQTTITNGEGGDTNNTSSGAGAVYIYKRNGANWAQEAFIKAANNDAGDKFGETLALGANNLAVGVGLEDSNQTFITNGTGGSADNSNADSGAVYLYQRTVTIASANNTTPPVLDGLASQYLQESDSSIQVFDANDNADDLDADGDSLAYTCWFDTSINNYIDLTPENLCNRSNMQGMNFNTSTGVLTWNPRDGQNGLYEFKLVATDNIHIDYAYVTVSISNDLSGPDCSDAGGDSWTAVLGDPDYGTEDFCVMKYEAKDNSGVPESVPAGTPWASINQQDARTECASLGLGYHLISNDEWMTLTSNAAGNVSNWSGSSVGSGFLNRGHTDGDPFQACDGYKEYVDTDCADSGSEAKFTEKRTNNLLDGSVVWDLGGNVSEWTSYFNDSDKPYDADDGGPVMDFREYTQIDTGFTTMPLSYLVPTNSVKSFWNDSWTSSENIGKYYAGANGSGGALMRGGSWASGATESGLFYANSHSGPMVTAPGIGFRCVAPVP